jgi:hypothetical protein
MVLKFAVLDVRTWYSMYYNGSPTLQVAQAFMRSIKMRQLSGRLLRESCRYGPKFTTKHNF